MNNHYNQGKKQSVWGGSASSMRLSDVNESVVETIEKKWGTEEVVVNNAHCVKIMTIKPGQQVSMHWHAEKDETFILISGELILETLNQEGILAITHLTKQLESFTLYKNVPHTFYCPAGQKEDTIFIEASTQDKVNDSYRIFPSGPRQPINNR